MNLDHLMPYPQRVRQTKKTFPKPKTVRLKADRSSEATARLLRKDLREVAGIRVAGKASFTVTLRFARRGVHAEGYRLEIDEDGATIVARDEAGLYYGTQTLLQLLALGESDSLPVLTIDDRPHYKLRSLMVDPGRAPHSLPYLKRIVRILARLKMNVLHLHLNDDQLCGLKFRKLPLGSENPAAITLSELNELVRYARRYHVTIMPEIECWGHAASFVYHYPDLYGGPGMWGGMSFGIGEDLFELFEKLFDELIPVLEPECLVHVGLDEARWALLPSVTPAQAKDYSPTTLVDRLHRILTKAGRKHGRKVTMHLWADHGGRPLPKRLEGKVVVEPWMYFERREADIRAKVRRYSGKGKTPFMMGGGMSSIHFGGHFGATRIWCQAARRSPNVQGITICNWENNALADRMIGLYGGSNYAWSPGAPNGRRKESDPYSEELTGQMSRRMQEWQARFRDADTEALNADRGPAVYRGYYCWGERAGRPVAPTVLRQEAGDEHAAAVQ